MKNSNFPPYKQILKRILPYRELKRSIEKFVYRPLFRLSCWLFIRTNQENTLHSPIFIVGCGHSGTTIMLAILDAHSKIQAISGESWVFFQHIFTRLSLLRTWDKKTLAQGKYRWAEKTPKHIYKIEEILITYPQAKILLMIRDGRDVACSIKNRTKDFSEGVQRWIDDNHAAQTFWHHPQVFVVFYEHLVKDTETTLKKIFDFIGEPIEPAIFQSHLKQKHWYANTDGHGTYRNNQINQPLFDGTERWKSQMTEEEKKCSKNGQMNY